MRIELLAEYLSWYKSNYPDQSEEQMWEHTATKTPVYEFVEKVGKFYIVCDIADYAEKNIHRGKLND